MVLSGDDRGREIRAEKTEKDRGRPCQFVGIEGFERVRLRDDDKDEEEDGEVEDEDDDKQKNFFFWATMFLGKKNNYF